MARVSVLLTCFNHIDFIGDALDSVRAQEFTDYEVIAIDDGSTDGTREWLSEQSDVRAIFNAQNLGTYETLNVGLRLATGEFIAVLNDDDLWRPRKLSRQIEVLDANANVGLVHTGGWFLDGKGDQMEGNPLGFAWPTFPVDGNGIWTGDALASLVPENKIIASAALARTALLRELGGFNSAYFGSGDWEMWFRVAEVAKVGFVAEELTGYRVHGANASHKLERIWRDDQRLREWMAGRIESAHESGRFSDAEYRKLSAFNFAALGTVRMLNGDSSGSRQAYRQSIRHQPSRWKSWARFGLTYAGKSAFRKSL